MRKKKTTRTIELTFERTEFFAVLKPRKSYFAECAECGGRVPVVTPEEAARASGESLREVFRRIEAAEVHFVETPDGALLVCLDSFNQSR